MKDLLWVGLGGFIGSALRHLSTRGFELWAAQLKFPLGTFFVNILGCLAIGVLTALIEKTGWVSTPARLFLVTGVLGGFTTFSAFGLETFNFLRSGEYLAPALYITLSVFIGLGAVCLGFRIVSFLLSLGSTQ
ncbi:MAG: fluoride efflux transporter CrcB [Verrucomicrobiota bacterium]|nr:fluoride efflux transporter CrcB [Verrucomicrobiota bacterium]